MEIRKEDFGTINDNDLSWIQTSLPTYYAKHLNQDLMVYVAREEADIISVPFIACGKTYKSIIYFR